MEDSSPVSQEHPHQAPTLPASPTKLPFSLTRNPEREKLPPELLSEYELVGEELLGEGAFAVVRLMRHCQSGELFALKCVEKHPLRIRNMIGQMQREVRIQQNLNHPNILRLVRAYDDNDYVYLLLEYCMKGELHALIHENPNRRLEEPVAALYFEQIVHGLAWMHRNGCIHRDVKLENMLLTENDVIKICDFGWSAEIEVENMLKTTCGTTYYWAPEIFEGELQDEAVDVWALGCMLYEMLAGHAPFHDQDPLKLKQKVLAGEFGYPPWFSNEACHLVHILLQRKPADRVRCEALIKHPWLSKYKDQLPQPAVEAPQLQQALADSPSSRGLAVTEADWRPPTFSDAAAAAHVPLPEAPPVWRAGRRLEAPRIAARSPGEPLLSFTGSSNGQVPSNMATVLQTAEPAMSVPARRFASPARQTPLPVTRAISPMHRVDGVRMASPARLDVFQAQSAYAKQERPPWSPGTQTFGGATGCGVVPSFGAQSLRPRVGSAPMPQSPVSSLGWQAYGGASGTGTFVLEGVMARDGPSDAGNAWRGLRTSVPLRQLPSAVPPPLGFVPGVLGASNVTNWPSLSGRELGGVAQHTVPIQRLPTPQPVHYTLPHPTLPAAPYTLPAAPYTLPHSPSGRLAPVASFSMAMPQRQAIGFGTGTYATSPRSIYA